jgi:putative SOS response-associated peptidase YedK
MPCHIRMPDQQLFAFCGLWDRWGREGSGFESCSIIVTQANAAVRPVHDRMPVILNRAQYNSWLNPAHYNRAQMESMLVPFSGQLDIYPISRRVNNPANDEASCIEPI